MTPESLTKPIINVLRWGRFILSFEVVEPGQQPASIQYYPEPQPINELERRVS